MPVTKEAFGGAVSAVKARVGHSDTLEVVMFAQISGDRTAFTGWVGEGADKKATYETKPWPKPGTKVRLPRQEALDLIRNELAYPTTGTAIRPNAEIEAAIASQDALA